MPVAQSSLVVRGRSVIPLGLAVLACVGVWPGRAWLTVSDDDPGIPQPAAAEELRSARISGEERTATLERRLATLEAALAPTRESSEASKGTPMSLGSQFAKLQAELQGAVGVAFGAPRGPVTVLGSLTTGPAWSTMKVPVAIAFVRQNGTSSGVVRRAITLSDNAAAMALWDSLGASTSSRVARVQRVLSDAGDQTSRVQGRVVRAGFTPFGQTIWSLSAQQAFAARLPCIRGAAPVLELMGQIDSSQRWGLGRIGTRPIFKGGWGPSPGGSYLVRQFGIIRVRSGRVAVAMAAQPADGSFTTGTRYLDRLAQWVAAHAVGGRPAACR